MFISKKLARSKPGIVGVFEHIINKMGCGKKDNAKHLTKQMMEKNARLQAIQANKHYRLGLRAWL